VCTCIAAQIEVTGKDVIVNLPDTPGFSLNDLHFGYEAERTGAKLVSYLTRRVATVVR
jgi:hypothetical protein